MESESDSFTQNGFAGPFSLFTGEQCALVLRHFWYGKRPAPLKWEKGQAVTDRLLFDLATRPALLRRLRLFLGENILLWGASLLTREPKQVHPWHSDIESSGPGGGFVSVWIGIDNTSRESALQLISGSHTIGKTIQEVAHERGLHRGDASAATVLDWAREVCPKAKMIQPEMRDGDGLFFDGRLWHGSENSRAQGTRTALLFQYAAAGREVKMPDCSHFEWPFRYQSSRVPVLLVSGRETSRANRLVAAPETGAPQLNNQFHPLKLPLPEDAIAGWRARHLFAGATPNVSHMNAHVSVLSAGQSPHPPHAHRKEEVLIVLDGEAELIIAKDEEGTEARYERLSAGSFVYYPAFQFHTIRNPGATPVTYLMFKWSGVPGETNRTLPTTIERLDIDSETNGAGGPKFLLEGSTHYLSKLHVHLTQLRPAAGYASHADAHDVAMVTLSGSVETMGHRIPPHSVVYFPAGEMHDMKNAGPDLARYLVFEFHRSGEAVALPAVAVGLPEKFARRVYRPLRQRLAATKLGRRLRPIYKRLK